MNRLRATFSRLKREGRCGLVAYLTCGDPDRETTIKTIRELEKSGADAIELGVPFSDPIADGPVIQAASQRALANRTSVDDVLGIAREIRSASEIPLVVFSYLNPILKFGVPRFAEAAAVAGVDAVLITDLPPDDSEPLRSTLRAKGIGMVFLLAPTSTDRRIRLVNRLSDDFIYYVSTNGVTGARSELDPTLLVRLTEVKKKVSRPLAVGFGVSKRQHFDLLSQTSEAVVVGSAIVRAMAAGDRAAAPERAGQVIREILGR